MIEVKKVAAGFTEYANRHILPKMPPTKQFVAGMALGLVGSRAEDLFGLLTDKEWAKALGLTDGRLVDIDRLYAVAKEQATKLGTIPIEVPMLGLLTFNSNDLDDLYRIICAI